MKKQPVKSIGSSVLVDIPEIGIKDIPAKVDTGADSSSIWASKIREKNGVLTYCLFGKGSRFYTGKDLKTTEYRQSVVRNSFGKSEVRYRINHKIRIGGRLIEASLNLADRSKNRYPVLIGKRTLKNKFIVDVSKDTEPSDVRVLVLVTQHKESVNKLFRELEKKTDKQMVFTVARYEDLIFHISQKKLWVGLEDGEDIASYNLIFIKSSINNLGKASAIAQYAEYKNTPVIDKSHLLTPSLNKLDQLIRLKIAKIPVIDSIFMSRNNLFKNYHYLTAQLGETFILKDINSQKGKNNFLVKNQKDFLKLIKKADKEHLDLIAQKYIENKGDFRVLIFGNQIAAVIFRKRINGTHINNTSHGAEAKLVDKNKLPIKIQNYCYKATKLMNLDIAGVDFIEDNKSKVWYCLEVNDRPQIASGAFVDIKRTATLDLLRKKVRLS